MVFGCGSSQEGGRHLPSAAAGPLQATAPGEGFDDFRTGMPPGIPEGAMCVQRFDDSLNSAIHTTYRISLRSSSMREPRDPLLKVLTCFLFVALKLRLASRSIYRVSFV